MFIVDPEHLTGASTVTSAGESMKDALAECPVGGVILFASNLESKEQTKQLLADMQAFSDIRLFTSVDEEGGAVARCAQKLGTTSFSSMATYGEVNDSDEAYHIGETLGIDLKDLGFNLDFAPVADININPANELGSRIFSSDPGVVANMATYVALGLQSQGVSATVKHFPGLGAEAGNTHTDSFVTIDRTVDQLRSEEFVPFSAAIAAGVDFVMVGHQITTGFGDNLPADLSRTAVTDYLRGELGFGGIAITDAQQMNTIVNVYGAGTAAVMSVQAGIDIILMPADIREAADAVIAAVENGTISEDRINESVLRILTKKHEKGLF
jgi:beta-N-acetylhexosaminidase